jgi:hypothetical protein
MLNKNQQHKTNGYNARNASLVQHSKVIQYNLPRKQNKGEKS